MALLRSWAPVLLGLVVLAAGLAPEVLGVGAPGLGRSQVRLVIAGALALVCGLVLRGPRALTLGDFCLAAGAAGLGAAAGMASGGDYWVAAGVGLLVGTLLAPAVDAGRWGREIVAAGSLAGTRLWWVLLAAGQAALATLIVRQYHLENEALFQSTMVIALVGFLVNLVLPKSVRLTYFVLLSMGGFVAILGWRIFAALLVPSAVLIGLCWLPVAMRVRVWALIGLACGLAWLRVSPYASVLPGAVWPLLGSIFMFRLIVYVYDLAHARNRPTLSSTLAYFFMLPNVVFPFFPVIDYTMFRRVYHDTDERKIHQDGAVFLFWGVLHLILYRVVNYYLLISPDTVSDLGSLARYLISNYLLYLRVSGQFHLIIGVLHLFGFHLPRTNNRYFLASSFTDLWRRINIYWKEFMLKVFYMPIYFRLKKLGETQALVLATILVFLLTWFFHAYQWFWLRGTFLFTGPDILFWAVLGVLVVVNSLIELRTGRKRSLSGPAKMSAAEWGGLAARTCGTFFVMATLWSLWSAASLEEWARLWSVVPRSIGMADAAVLGGGLLLAGVWFGPWRAAGAGAGGAAGGAGAPPPRKLGGGPKGPVVTLGPSLAVGGALLVVWLIGVPRVSERLGDDVARVMRDLRWARLSDADQAKKERGYYENLNAVNSFNSQLWELYMRRPVYQEIWNTDAVRQLPGDFLVNELNPNVSIVFRGAPYRTNRWGMRDDDYPQVPAPGTFRLALLGDSHTEGWGVGNSENFEHLLEDRLNAERSSPERVLPGYDRVELLNFAVGGYLPPQMLVTLERKVFSFQPTAVMLVAHPGDGERVLYQIAKAVREDRPIPYPELAAIGEKHRIDRTMSEADAVKLMMADADTSLAMVYRRIVDACRAHGVPALWCYIPSVPGRADPGDRGPMNALAARMGFITFDLGNVFDRYEQDEVRIGEWDQHPNKFGHRVMADALYEAWRARGGDLLR